MIVLSTRSRPERDSPDSVPLDSLQSERRLTHSEHEHTNFQLLFSRKHSTIAREKKSRTNDIRYSVPLKGAKSYSLKEFPFNDIFIKWLKGYCKTTSYRWPLERDPLFQLLLLERWQGFYVQITWFTKWFIGKYISL